MLLNFETIFLLDIDIKMAPQKIRKAIHHNNVLSAFIVLNAL